MTSILVLIAVGLPLSHAVFTGLLLVIGPHRSVYEPLWYDLAEIVADVLVASAAILLYEMAMRGGAS